MLLCVRKRVLWTTWLQLKLSLKFLRFGFSSLLHSKKSAHFGFVDLFEDGGSLQVL
jgi:hypothetical protein